MRDLKLFVIVGLLFLLLVSLGGIYFVYQKNIVLQNKNKENISVVVAKKNIPQNKKITKEDIKIMQFQKAMVPFKVIIPNEIIGKYAAVPIFRDEPIREEKISKIIEHTEVNSTAIKAKYDLYNISSKLFRNPNFMLKSGDLIDIIGVWKENKKLIVKYIATNTKVYGFLFQGVLEEKALKIVEKKIKDKKSKKMKLLQHYLYADELLLDTRADIVTSIIRAHNKGNQLWMVLSGDKDKAKIIQQIKTQFNKHTHTGKKCKKRKYYSPKATISYGAESSSSVTVWRH